MAESASCRTIALSISIIVILSSTFKHPNTSMFTVVSTQTNADALAMEFRHTLVNTALDPLNDVALVPGDGTPVRA